MVIIKCMKKYINYTITIQFDIMTLPPPHK